MPQTVAQVLALVDGFAPFALAEEWDNVGLLAGRSDAPVRRVLCALDLTEEVLREAEEKGAEVILTHHPILFRGRKNLREDDGEGRLLAALVRAEKALIAAHTNFDNADPGVNGALADLLGIGDQEALATGVRIGAVPETTLGEFAEMVARRLGGPVRRYGDPETRIRRAAVLGGSGGHYAVIALQAGADVFVTGETGYHEALDSLAAGMCTLEAGHAATEFPAVAALARSLQTAADAVKYDLEAIESETCPFL